MMMGQVPHGPTVSMSFAGNPPPTMTEQQARTKREDEQFCSECGEAVSKGAVVCMHCGVLLRP